MKVWIFDYFEYGDVSTYSEDTDVLALPAIATELSYLDNDAYRDEHDNFIADVNRARERGRGEACIEERLRLTLEEVR